MEAVLTEAERTRRYGFTESELTRAKEDFTGSFENYWRQRDDMESSSIVDILLDAYLMDDSYPSIDWQWNTVQDLLPGIGLKDVQAVAETLLTEKNRVVLVKGPSVPAITDISESEIRDVLERTQTAEIEPWEDSSAAGPLVEETPSPGKIISRSEIEGTGIQTWVLSNGAVVLLKTTDFKEDEILFQAVSPGGTSLVDDSDYISAQYAADAVSQGGLGYFSLVDLRKNLAGKTLDIEPFIYGTHEGLSGNASKRDLETLMQLIYLQQTAPRRDETAWNAFMNRTAESLRNRASSPKTIYDDLVWETVFNNHPRIRPITLDDLDQADLDTALDIYRDRFADAGDFTYIFVGDVTAEELETARKNVDSLSPLLHRRKFPSLIPPGLPGRFRYGKRSPLRGCGIRRKGTLAGPRHAERRRHPRSFAQCGKRAFEYCYANLDRRLERFLSGALQASIPCGRHGNDVYQHNPRGIRRNLFGGAFTPI